MHINAPRDCFLISLGSGFTFSAVRLKRDLVFLMSHLDNYVTESKARVSADKNTPLERMQAILEKARNVLRQSGNKVYTSTANLNGIAVQLVTNVYHQWDFWKANWHTAPEGLLPHATIYSVNGIPGEEPKAYYCPALATSVFVNTEYYGQCKSWALGMSAVVLAKRFNTHSIHGALASWKGKGVVIVAPTGTGKTTQAFKLFMQQEGKIVGDDWVYVKFPTELNVSNRKSLIAVQPEKALYMRTETEKDQPWLRPIFDKCKLENILTMKEECEFLEQEEDFCKQTNSKCVFTRLKTDHCYYAFGNSRALVPRELLLGSEKVADEAPVKLVVLLRRDSTSPAAVELDSDEAIDVLKKGEYQIRPGAGPKELWGKMGNESWYNPYLLEKDDESQERYFRMMFEDWGIRCLLLNTSMETVDQTHARILEAIKNAS
jgi:hypothetical protein